MADVISKKKKNEIDERKIHVICLENIKHRESHILRAAIRHLTCISSLWLSVCFIEELIVISVDAFDRLKATVPAR